MVFNQLKIDDSLCDFPIDLTDNLCFAQDDGSIIIPLSVDTIKDFYDNITDNTIYINKNWIIIDKVTNNLTDILF